MAKKPFGRVLHLEWAVSEGRTTIEGILPAVAEFVRGLRTGLFIYVL